MHRLGARSIRGLAAVGLLATLAACGDDNGDPTGLVDDLQGTWQVTRFQGAGFPDFIAGGMTLTVTLAETTYSLFVTNDLADICLGLNDCSTTGTYSATGSQITLDPGTADAITFNYTIQGNSMTWTGSIEGLPVTIEATKIA